MIYKEFFMSSADVLSSHNPFHSPLGSVGLTAREEIDNRLKRPPRSIEEAVAVCMFMANQLNNDFRDSLRNSQETQKINALEQKGSLNAYSVTVYALISSLAQTVGSAYGLHLLHKTGANPISEDIKQKINIAQTIGSGVAGAFNAASTAANNNEQANRTVLNNYADRLRLQLDELVERGRMARQLRDDLMKRHEQLRAIREDAFRALRSQ